MTQTNLVIKTENNIDNRKFVCWNIEETEPQEVLSGLELTRMTFDDGKKVFEHPLENGSTIIDYVVLEPKKATLQAYIAIDDEATLTELMRLYLNSTLLRIRAENNVVNNVIIASKPFETTSTVFDKTLYSIALQEAQFVMPQYVKMPNAKKKSNVSRVNSGIKQGNKTVEKKSSWLASAIFGGRT